MRRGNGFFVALCAAAVFAVLPAAATATDVMPVLENQPQISRVHALRPVGPDGRRLALIATDSRNGNAIANTVFLADADLGSLQQVSDKRMNANLGGLTVSLDGRYVVWRTGSVPGAFGSFDSPIGADSGTILDTETLQRRRIVSPNEGAQRAGSRASCCLRRAGSTRPSGTVSTDSTR